ncbi:MAG: ABC transporter permease [Pseudolysinimonas sp.]
MTVIKNSGIETARIVRLVAAREITMRLRSVAFLVSTGILLAIVLASIIIGGISVANPSELRVAVVSGVNVGNLPGVVTIPVDDRAGAEALLRSGDVEAAIVPDPRPPLGIELLGDKKVPTELIQLLSVAPPVELLDTTATNPFLSYLVAFGFGIVFFVSAMTFGMTIAQSVVEEKSTRVIEILLAAIPTRALLTGKILGTSVLAIAQIVLIGLLGVTGAAITGQLSLIPDLGPAVAWFGVFFVVGFVLLASLFAATGALVSRQEDIGSTTTPVTMLVMIPYFLVIFFNDNPVVVTVMSYVPFSAPIAMPLRVFLGTAQWWEPLLSLALLVLTTALLIRVGARIYERSLLKLGARVSWREALAR